MILADQEGKVFEQLQQIVPTLPKNRKVSKLEVIENVIDYIMNLERVLQKPESQSLISGNKASLPNNAM